MVANATRWLMVEALDLIADGRSQSVVPLGGLIVSALLKQIVAANDLVHSRD